MYDLKQGRIPEESYPKCDCKRYLSVLLRTLFLRIHDQHLETVLDVREADIRIVVEGKELDIGVELL